jgi:hypothetical protein
MKLQRSVVIIVDVSGYTSFVKMHGMSIIHAEWLISELMKSMAQEFKMPIKLNKLEGDAALFFAPIPASANEDEFIQFTTKSALNAFKAFQLTKSEMLAANLCPCCACPELDKLSLKAIFSIGDLVVKNVLGRQELAGDAVIITHRLLKNSLKSHEYFLMTKEYYKKAKAVLADLDVQVLKEPVSGYGEVEGVVLSEELLNKKIGELPKPKRTFVKTVLQLLNMQYYTLKRSAKLVKKQNYANLPT